MMWYSALLSSHCLLVVFTKVLLQIRPTEMFRIVFRHLQVAGTKGAHLRTLQKVDFSDPTIFRQKSIWWLLRALFVLRMCSIEFISNNSVALMKRAESVLGPFLTYNTIVKKTVYGHFCAGEADRELRNTIKSLEGLGIGSVLDYAAEADAEGFAPAPGMAEAPNLSMASLVNNTSVTYLPHKQAYDENMKLYVMCVLHSALHKPKGGVGLAAVKVTGMCDPQLLARVSAILHMVHRDWIEYFTEEQPPPVEECNVVMGTKTEHKRYITRDQVRKGLTNLAASRKYTEDEIKAVLDVLDPDNEGRTNYYKFKTVVSEAVLPLDLTQGQKIIFAKLPNLPPKERELCRHCHWRWSVIVEPPKDWGERVLLEPDQPFSHLAMAILFRKFRARFTGRGPPVYTRSQCSWTHTEDGVFKDLRRADLEGWFGGGKVVRGAYM
ncbi:unnamed protein product, partial [Trypanosoma congolense IL3000]